MLNSVFRPRLFFAYLLLTICLELPILWLLVRRGFKSGSEAVSSRLLILAGLVSTGATYPWLWFVFPALVDQYHLSMIWGEAFVILFESLVFFGILRLSVGRAIAASVACNGFSILIGLVLNEYVELYKLFI